MTPERWAVLGQAIRDDRHRQGLTLQTLEARTVELGTRVSSRTIGTLERGGSWKTKPPSLEPTVKALGWLPGWTDRILAGEDPNAVLHRSRPEAPTSAPQSELVVLLPGVYKFGRTAVRLGAPSSLGNEFADLADRLIDAVKASQSVRDSLGLASLRSHAEGEGIPADDVERIRRALGES